MRAAAGKRFESADYEHERSKSSMKAAGVVRENSTSSHLHPSRSSSVDRFFRDADSGEAMHGSSTAAGKPPTSGSGGRFGGGDSGGSRPWQSQKKLEKPWERKAVKNEELMKKLEDLGREKEQLQSWEKKAVENDELLKKFEGLEREKEQLHRTRKGTTAGDGAHTKRRIHQEYCTQRE